MPAPRVFRDTVWESGTKYNRARIVDRSGNVLVQGDFTGSVVLRVYDMAAADVDSAILSNTSTIASNVYNTLQSWDVDGEGYNFEHAITTNDVEMDGGHTYRACYTLTHTSEGAYTLVFEMSAKTLFSL